MPWPLRVFLALLVPVLAGAAVGGYLWLHPPRDGATPADQGKTLDRSGNTIKFSTALAESYGIRATAATDVQWREQPVVYGRVVPNPHAGVEVRAPFAGVIKLAPSRAWPKLGDVLQAEQTVALLETRLTPQERIDLRAKNAEAQAKHRGAEEAVKIQEARFKRLEELDRTGALAPRELDAARLLLLEVRSQRDAAQAQAKIYEQALASPEGKSVLVPLSAPLAGEVAELFAQPGLTVEAGHVCLKIADYRRCLVRLEFPIALASGPPPAEVAVSVVTGDVRESPVSAHWTGSAGQVETASQRVNLFYTLDAPPAVAWRPGLFVKASFPHPSAKPRDAVAIPASALLYHQGRTLVYVQLSPGRFERREVEVLDRHGNTLILGDGVRAGEDVVHEQAQVLLSAEFRRDTDDDD